MTKDNNNSLWILTGITAAIVAAYLYNDNKKLRFENEVLNEKQQNFLILIRTIKESSRFNNQIKQELLSLIDKFKNIDQKIANELAQSLQLLQIGQTENAIEDLVKIMENILESKYKNDISFKSWLRNKKLRLSLHNLLTHAKNTNDIDEVEYNFFFGS